MPRLVKQGFITLFSSPCLSVLPFQGNYEVIPPDLSLTTPPRILPFMSCTGLTSHLSELNSICPLFHLASRRQFPLANQSNNHRQQRGTGKFKTERKSIKKTPSSKTNKNALKKRRKKETCKGYQYQHIVCHHLREIGGTSLGVTSYLEMKLRYGGNVEMGTASS